MKVNVVFTGLCSILNPTGTTPKMGDPAVILVRTDRPGAHSHDVVPHDHTGGGTIMDPADRHTPFLAFDSSKFVVNNATEFERFDQKEQFWFHRLDGVELVLKDANLSMAPTVLPTFKKYVVKKDDYWPQAIGEFNRDYVPQNPGDRPVKSAVHAFIRLGVGELAGARLTLLQWKFDKPEGTGIHVGNFAEEVIYSFDTAAGAEEVTVDVNDLTTTKIITTLKFAKRDVAMPDPLILFIGNNNDDSMTEVFERKSSGGEPPAVARHIGFLNDVADVNVRVKGPVPTPLPAKPKKTPSGSPLKGTGDGGGGSAGFCGPGNANGG